MSSDSLLPFGIYETPVTARIQERIEETKRTRPTAALGIAHESKKDRETLCQSSSHSISNCKT